MDARRYRPKIGDLLDVRLGCAYRDDTKHIYSQDIKGEEYCLTYARVKVQSIISPEQWCCKFRGKVTRCLQYPKLEGASIRFMVDMFPWGPYQGPDIKHLSPLERLLELTEVSD